MTSSSSSSSSLINSSSTKTPLPDTLPLPRTEPTLNRAVASAVGVMGLNHRSPLLPYLRSRGTVLPSLTGLSDAHTLAALTAVGAAVVERGGGGGRSI